MPHDADLLPRAAVAGALAGLAACLAACLAQPAAARPLEPPGVRLAMPLAEFVALSRAKGYALEGRDAAYAVVPEADWPKAGLVVFQLGGTPRDPGPAVTVCRGIVAGYGTLRPGSVHEFSEAVAAAQRHHGPGVATARRFDVERVPVSSLETSWSDPRSGTRYHVELSANGGGSTLIQRWRLDPSPCPET